VDADERIDRARLLYERAVFNGETGALATADRELDAVEADLALARGRIIHARFLARRDQHPQEAHDAPGELELFERAARLYHVVGDVRGEAESVFWVGTYHQIVRGDDAAALHLLERAYALAAEAGDLATMSEALRHLGIAAHRAGRLDEARERLEESVRLRRETGSLPGVAANLVGLAYIAAGQGREDDARALIEEAAALAESTGAERVMRSIEQARADLASPAPLPQP
jgi:tetratricopeptide (TPR) repeat protein